MECRIFYNNLHPKEGKHYFGTITKSTMYLSEIGKIANTFWNEIPNHFPSVQLGAFVIMPNHIHGIIIIDKQVDNNTNVPVETRHCLVSTDKTNLTIGQQRFQNQGKHTISSIVGSYKSIITKHACKIHADFAWQSRFYDHIIRNKQSFNRITEYIENNVRNWEK